MAVIRVVGIGGGGGNAINRMITEGVSSCHPDTRQNCCIIADSEEENSTAYKDCHKEIKVANFHGPRIAQVQCAGYA